MYQKRVLITGANRGIGLEFARQFHDKGYHVIATARHSVCEELSKLQNIQIEIIDITDQDSIDRLSRKMSGQNIDILINNAGITTQPTVGIEKIDIALMQKNIEVNTIGPVRMVQAFLQNLRLGKEKMIINISSIGGSIKLVSKNPLLYNYGASKAALHFIAQTLAKDLMTEGFIVASLHPGWVRTDMGGADATFSTNESVSAMMGIIESLERSSSGQFLDIDGKELPW